MKKVILTGLIALTMNLSLYAQEVKAVATKIVVETPSDKGSTSMYRFFFTINEQNNSICKRNANWDGVARCWTIDELYEEGGVKSLWTALEDGRKGRLILRNKRVDVLTGKWTIVDYFVKLKK